jgi:hypothetical protein
VASLKGVELANLAGDTLEDHHGAKRGIQRIRGTPHLAYSFLRSCALSRWQVAIMTLERAKPPLTTRSNTHPCSSWNVPSHNRASTKEVD